MPRSGTTLHQPNDIREYDQQAAYIDYRTPADDDADRRQWDAEATGIRDYAAAIDPPGFDAVQLAPADHTATVAAIRSQLRERDRPGCRDSSYRSKQERTTATRCHRAIGLWVRGDDGAPVYVRPPCRSRTCADCRPAIDGSDAERIADGIGPDAWIAEIPRDQWIAVSTRLRRHDATRLQCASNRDPTKVVVVADEPPTADAHKLTDPATAIRDLLATRPTGQARRLTTTGRIVGRDEWDDRYRAEAIAEDWAAPGVSLADIELVAAALGVATSVTADTVTLRCKWDDWRSVAIRRWGRNPSRVEWADMYRDTLRGEGIPVDDPPLVAYAEAS